MIVLTLLADVVPPSPAPSSPPLQFSTPQGALIYVLLGILLGATGQGIRAIVGWKQMNDQAAQTNSSIKDLFDPRVFLMSFAIGAVAGICAMLGLVASNTAWSTKCALGIVAAGYAGADFIEGFVSQYLPKTNPTPAAPAAPPVDPNKVAATAEGRTAVG